MGGEAGEQQRGSFLEVSFEVSFLGFLEVGRWNNDTSTARDGKALLPPPYSELKNPLTNSMPRNAAPLAGKALKTYEENTGGDRWGDRGRGDRGRRWMCVH